MKKRSLILTIIIILTAFTLSAQDYPFAPNSVATMDGFLAPRLNPAALGVGNTAGFAFTSPYNRDDLKGGMDSFFQDFGLFFSIPNFAYSYENLSREGYHNFALGLSPVLNNYMGFGLRWRKGNFDEPAFTLSFLSRPLDFLSLGGVFTFPSGADAEYRLGLGVRPFIFSSYLEERLTASLDITYREREWKNPLVSFHTELFDGFFLNAGYDLESDWISAGFSFFFPHVQIGSLGLFEKTPDFQSGNAFIFLSAKEFRSIAKQKQQRFVEYELEPVVLEERPGLDLIPFKVIKPGKTLYQVVKEIEKLKEDKSVSGVVFINQNFVTSYANYMEISNALKDFKAFGKKVIFYYQNIDNLNYTFSASVADRIYLQPQGYISLAGIAVARPYLKGFLDMVGIEVVNMKSHAYKTPYNIFSESEMTDAEHEQLDSVVESLYSSMCDMIKSGRGERLKRPVEEIIDKGPYLEASRALNEGLIDGIIYLDELDKELQKTYPGFKTGKYIFTGDIRYDWSTSPSSRVAIIYATGPIHTGESDQSSSIGSDTITHAIQKARKDPFISGIILRVSSGGGSAVASDAIAREIALTVSGDNPKPVIVSMGGTAASGGYYISSQASKIVAQPVTITGSIGVVAVFPNIVGLSDKLNINWETIKKGEKADMGAIYRKMTEKEKKIVGDFLSSTYKKFVEVVAEGRDLNAQEVEKVAQGRMWTGEQAKQKGLVDDLGGLSTSIKLMKKLLETREEIELVEVKGKKPISSFKGSFALAKGILGKDIPPELKAVVEVARGLELFGDEAVLMIAPYYFGINE